MRQAVVIIHGMGEQKPMSTLRGFIDSLVKHEAAEKIKSGELKAYKKNFWSKPDKMSESFELRKLVLAAGKSKRPTTDFFEYYWAFNMQGTGMGHIIPWFKTLLLNWPWKVPNRLFFPWLISWILTLCIAAGFIFFFSNDENNPLGDGLQGKVLSFLLTSILIGAQSALIGSIGDAARYLTPNPENISERHNIRKDGIELMRKLHEKDENGNQQYDRIIMVAHSLGSVIAYDIITHLWAEYNSVYGEGKIVDKDYFEAVKTAADELELAIKAGMDKTETDHLKAVFQKKQMALGKAMREAGCPWLITDFVTMGCPLAHGAFLLSRNATDFEERKADRELLACPPVLDDNGKYYYYNRDEKRYYLHHAAAFAATVWTNIYFPGDFIGGPVSGEFGHGIKDVEVVYNGFFNKWISHISPLTHIKYWRDSADLEKMDVYKNRDAIKALYDAVDLDRD